MSNKPVHGGYPEPPKEKKSFAQFVQDPLIAIQPLPARKVP